MLSFTLIYKFILCIYLGLGIIENDKTIHLKQTNCSELY